VKAGEVIFQDLLNGKVQYRVPLFQRTYSWQEEQWQRLWDDILEIYALAQPRSHFIGAIVTLPMPDSPEHCSKFMLIDGQQRLVTLFALLSVIRDAARATPESEQLAAQITEECLINRFAQRPEERVKMRPTQQDLDDFNRVVLGDGAACTTRIGKVKHFFEGALNAGDLDGDPFNLAKIHRCVTGYLSLVSIRLDQDDSPHRIFESLNNTGMALTASDLIRNHIFMQIPEETEQNRAYRQYWLPMQARMGTDDGGAYLSDFFWRYLMKDGNLPRYDEVFEGMRDHINTQVCTGRRTIVQVLEELNRFSEHYACLWKPQEHEPCERIARHMSRLNQWEVDVAYPVLLDAYEKRRTGSIGEDEIVELLRMIESYVVRRFVCGIPTNRLRRVFARMAGKVDPTRYVHSCRQYLMDNEWPNDASFREHFQTARMYIASRLSRLRLILSSLEESYEHHEPIQMHDAITIEHLMPQTLNDWWKEHLGPDYREVHEKYLHTIGNLTYSGYNPEMGNDPFDQKKQVLAQSHFELNRDIIQCAQWSAEEIKARAAKLADRALVIWKRDN